MPHSQLFRDLHAHPGALLAGAPPVHPQPPLTFPAGRALAAYANLAAPRPQDVRDRFTLGIVDDVAFSSLPVERGPEVLPAGTTECLFWGMGSDGTVGANKEAVKIIASQPGVNAQVRRVWVWVRVLRCAGSALGWLQGWVQRGWGVRLLG